MLQTIELLLGEFLGEIFLFFGAILLVLFMATHRYQTISLNEVSTTSLSALKLLAATFSLNVVALLLGFSDSFAYWYLVPVVSVVELSLSFYFLVFCLISILIDAMIRIEKEGEHAKFSLRRWRK